MRLFKTKFFDDGQDITLPIEGFKFLGAFLSKKRLYFVFAAKTQAPNVILARTFRFGLPFPLVLMCTYFWDTTEEVQGSIER